MGNILKPRYYIPVVMGIWVRAVFASLPWAYHLPSVKCDDSRTEAQSDRVDALYSTKEWTEDTL